MARDDDPVLRRRRREEERERDEADEAARKARLNDTGGKREIDTDLIKRGDDFLRRVPGMLEQLDHLYHQYATGVLARPPIEERKRLDQLMTTLFNIPKATPADRFRFNTINASFTTHRNRWEKLMLDIEKGLIKRITGPNRGR